MNIASTATKKVLSAKESKQLQDMYNKIKTSIKKFQPFEDAINEAKEFYINNDDDSDDALANKVAINAYE